MARRKSVVSVGQFSFMFIICFISHKNTPTAKQTNLPTKPWQKPQTHQPNTVPSQNPRKSHWYYLLSWSLLGMYSQQCCKQNTSLPSSEIRRMFYRVPGMKSGNSLDICNIQFSSLSYVLQISCARFLQKAVQTGSHIFTRSPAEGIKKHIFLFLRETIFQLAWLELRNKSTHIIYTCNPIHYFLSLARKGSHLLLAFIIFCGREAADNCPILLQCNLSVQQDTLNHLLRVVELVNIVWRHNQVSFTAAVQKRGNPKAGVWWQCRKMKS